VAVAVSKRFVTYARTHGPRIWQRGLAWLRGRGELGTLAAVLAIALMCLTFARLADEMVAGETHAFDSAVMLAMRSGADPSDPIGPDWFEQGVKDVTSLGSSTVLVLVSLAVIGFMAIYGTHSGTTLITASVGGGLLLVTVLKHFFARDRPDLVPHAVQVFSASFPSGHATLSAVTYLTLGALLARAQERRGPKAYVLGTAILLTLMVGISRVYLGVHWPTDVLGGWCIGAAWAIGCWMAAVWLERRGKVDLDVET
jgi:undecaprenyl-diphosphatase